MKEVILHEEKKVVTVNKVESKFYYGILLKSGSKGFLVRSKWKGGEYKVMCTSLLTEGNTFASFSGDDTLQGVISNRIVLGIKVYQFETSSELFTWLAE